MTSLSSNQPARTSRPAVVYVVGAARSGSTLLTSLLGGVDGVAAVAELRLLWTNFAGRRCGCGQPVTTCPLWSRVLNEARAAGLTGPGAVKGVQHAAIGKRHVPRLARASGLSDLDGRTRRYAKLMDASYVRIAEHTGAHVIVDSSKSAAEAALLRHLPSVETYLVHLVRDPRAVVYSWRRAGAANPAQRKRLPRAIGSWLSAHMTAELAMRQHPADRHTTVRYEDLAAEPDRVVGTIVSMLRLPPANAQPRAAATHVQHMVGGNRLRMQQTTPTVRVDTEWRDHLPAGVALAVTATTAPLLRRYRVQPG